MIKCIDFAASESEPGSQSKKMLKIKLKTLKPPTSPVRPKSFAPLSLKPPIVLSKGAKGFGFTLKAIRVYMGDTSDYTVHHLVEVTFFYDYCYFHQSSDLVLTKF